MPNLDATQSQSRDEAFVAAREGTPEAVGDLLESYRSYLRLLAASQLHGKLTQRVSPSDVVQETMLAAHRDFADFHGKTPAEFTSWLRTILSHKLLNAMDQHLSNKRDARREVSIDAMTRCVASGDGGLRRLLVTSDPSPSATLSRDEDSQRIAALMARLPPHYREVIVLRNFQGLRFEAVSQQLSRTPLAARLLWLRAIQRLRQLYDVESRHDS